MKRVLFMLFFSDSLSSSISIILPENSLGSFDILFSVVFSRDRDLIVFSIESEVCKTEVIKRSKMVVAAICVTKFLNKCFDITVFQTFPRAATNVLLM